MTLNAFWINRLMGPLLCLIWVYPEVTPHGQWIILITDKGLVFSVIVLLTY